MDEPWPGVLRRSFDGQRATVTLYDFEAGAEFPLHSHPQEQITLVEEGDLQLTVGGSVVRLRPGDWSVIPPDVPHGISAGSAGARVFAMVVPRRQSPNAYTMVDTGQ
jgi:quercetin dioxygenase-like cupin family protein